MPKKPGVFRIKVDPVLAPSDMNRKRAPRPPKNGPRPKGKMDPARTRSTGDWVGKHHRDFDPPPRAPELEDPPTQVLGMMQTTYKLPGQVASHLSPDLIKQFARLHAFGVALPVVAAGLGVKWLTVKEWARKGRLDVQAGRDTPFAQFVAAVYEAKAACEINLIQRMQEGAAVDWKAAAWLLERRYDRWADPNKRVVKPLDDYASLSMDELRKLASGQLTAVPVKTAEEEDPAFDEAVDEDELPPMDIESVATDANE